MKLALAGQQGVGVISVSPYLKIANQFKIPTGSKYKLVIKIVNLTQPQVIAC